MQVVLNAEATAALEQMCTMMAMTVPHERASQMVKQLLAVEVSAKGIKSLVARRALAMVQQMDQEDQDVQAFHQRWERWPEIDSSSSPPPDVVYLELDGVSMPVRQDVERPEPTRPGRGDQGRRYELTGREIKNAILYQETACAKESDRRGCLLQKVSLSHLEEWWPLALLIWTQMLNRGYHRAKRIVVLRTGPNGSIRQPVNRLRGWKLI